MRKLGWGRRGGKPGKEIPREGAKRHEEGCKESKGPRCLGKTGSARREAQRLGGAWLPGAHYGWALRWRS